MLEAAASIMFIILLIGAIIDFGFGLWQYNFLNYTTTRSAREISARLSTANDCRTVNSYLDTTAKKEMAMSAGSEVTWEWCVVEVGGDRCLSAGEPRVAKSIRLTGRLPLKCYFLCTIVPKNWSITASGASMIENPAAQNCTGAYP